MLTHWRETGRQRELLAMAWEGRRQLSPSAIGMTTRPIRTARHAVSTNLLPSNTHYRSRPRFQISARLASDPSSTRGPSRVSVPGLGVYDATAV